MESHILLYESHHLGKIVVMRLGWTCKHPQYEDRVSTAHVIAYLPTTYLYLSPQSSSVWTA